MGWTRLATGDWSWVLASPDGAQAARVSPWDAAYRLHADLCQRTRNRYLQRIDDILPLGEVGHVVLMERLLPASETASAAFCAALAVSGDSGWQAPEGRDLGPFANDPQLDILREHLRAVVAAGESLPFWGGPDVRPGNVMADAAGNLKLIDPVFVAGRKIVAAIVERDREALERLPPGALAAFLKIPVFDDGAAPLRGACVEMGLLVPWIEL
ncbi:MAG TPA: hypothetical protein VFE13_13395 [Caulobacteraceae bacterium]|nr:hypothetical protein [Caulobacteraceae bacterium]